MINKSDSPKILLERPWAMMRVRRKMMATKMAELLQSLSAPFFRSLAGYAGSLSMSMVVEDRFSLRQFPNTHVLLPNGLMKRLIHVPMGLQAHAEVRGGLMMAE